MSDDDLNELVELARKLYRRGEGELKALHRLHTLSTGEHCFVVLASNRFDLLNEDMTIVDAFTRVGPKWREVLIELYQWGRPF